MSSGQLTGVVGDWESRMREGQEGGEGRRKRGERERTEEGEKGREEKRG